MTRLEKRSSTTERREPSLIRPHGSNIASPLLPIDELPYIPEPADSVPLVLQAHGVSWSSDDADGKRIAPALASDEPPVYGS